MEPGILDVRPELSPIRRIAPSAFGQLMECRLRAAWSGSRIAALLPTPPSARVGSVSHGLLQEAADGRLGALDRRGIESRWNELVQAIEGEMQEKWLERHLVPLHNSVARYEVTKERTLAVAAVITEPANWAQPLQEGTAVRSTGLTEQWIESPDGTIGGRIDRVLYTKAGTVIQDYKTGEILEEIDGRDQVKPEYRTQLMLYAALWAQSTGVWPVRLELVPLTGEQVIVDFDPRECLALFDQARSALDELNLFISTRGNSGDEALLELATPKPEVCSGCQYRPLCPAYCRADRSSTGEYKWTKDVIGRLDDFKILQNSKLLVTITDLRSGEVSSTVRGLSNSSHRHPALMHIKIGDHVGIFNLMRSGKDVTYSEALLTTMYLYSNSLKQMVQSDGC